MTTHPTSKNKQLLLLELNELNFDIVRRYTEKFPSALPNFRQLLALDQRATSSEDTYEQLEPWIQWVSAHSGLTAGEHGIFRLGDAVDSDVPQILDQLGAGGLTVGGVSPMNMANRHGRSKFFIPDPWTQTPTDGSRWSRKIWSAISQAVNDNAHGRLEKSTVVWLALAFARFARPTHYGLYVSLLKRSRGAPWRKALFLDLFLHDVHVALNRSHRPNFSILFLNAAAHIQHHYLFNAKALDTQKLRNPDWYVADAEDPFGDMLQVYDVIIGHYLRSHTDLIAATGLTQVPYDRVKYYYRLKDHAALLRELNIPFDKVVPRMTRDFLVDFASEDDANTAARVLSKVETTATGVPVFREIEHRGKSLFVTLTYPEEIRPGFEVRTEAGATFDLHPHVAFVAIKNGMHSSKGFSYYRGGVAAHAPPEGAHVKALHHTVLSFFGLAPSRPVSP